MKYWLLLLYLGISCGALAQKTDKKLQRQVDALTKDFRGTIGIYIQNLNNDRIVQINQDTIFPTASIVKIPILIGVMDAINRGTLSYNQSLTYKDSLLYAGVDILGSFKSGEKIDLSKVMMLMMTMSDNTASLWLQSLAGTGTRINAILDSLGLRYTRVNSRTPGREPNRLEYGWGQMTPKEMATLVRKMSKGEIISRASSDHMLRLMNRNFFDEVSISQLPPYATVFAKYGAVNEVRSEVVMVKGKKANYVFCIATKNNTDQSWKSDNEAWVLTRKLSKLLWDYFEPGDTWEPAEGAERFY